jgi:glycosyltransferase involved in cell wall biosynthesis
LLFVGDPFEHPVIFTDVQRAVERVGLAGRVTWIPFSEDVRRELAAMNLLVLCGEREALGRCVVEAMSMEIPVIVTDDGGSGEIVGASGGGLTVRPGDPQALAEAMVRMCADRSTAAQFGRAGRAYVLTHLKASESAKRMAKLYTELIPN